MDEVERRRCRLNRRRRCGSGEAAWRPACGAPRAAARPADGGAARLRTTTAELLAMVGWLRRGACSGW